MGFKHLFQPKQKEEVMPKDNEPVSDIAELKSEAKSLQADIETLDGKIDELVKERTKLKGQLRAVTHKIVTQQLKAESV